MEATVIDLGTVRSRNNARAEKSRRGHGVKPRVYAGPTKVCSCCKTEKDRATDFYQSMQKGKMIAMGYCKVCCSEKQKALDWAVRLSNQVRARHKKRWGGESDITPEHLRMLFERQNGKCAWLRVPLRTESSSFHHPSQVSLDRIEQDKGYTIDNVLLVSQAANLARCDAPVEVFEDFLIAMRRA